MSSEPSQNGDSPAQKPLHELLSSTLVDIYVGEENSHYPLHEKLLCHHSPFFSSIFYNKSNKASRTKEFGLPELDDNVFALFVGWLYSRAIRSPEEEKDIGPLLDLYFLAAKLDIAALETEIVELVRAFYHTNETYPGLRRVQYVYANTEADNVMREMMVGSVARFLTLSDSIPEHWAKALKKNGQLSVDIIRSIQQWHLEARQVPDARDASVDRGRNTFKGAVGFSVEEGRSEMADVKEESEEDAEGEEEESHVNGNGDA
ncbi:MAG: hypothetical protein L6R37_007069 [Teloschistes peruensis]|nr:MAG: hypothetical protein L6R37_007069 [Teloschistes peruensis]